MKASDQSQRKFPRTCIACREKQVRPALIDRVAEVKYEGKLYSVMATDVPVERCENCGSTTYGVESEERIDAALRDQLGLLQPQVIRQNRIQLGMKQEEMATALGCASESISRWESGAFIQSRSSDRLMRAFFQLPELRAFLAGVDEALVSGDSAGSQVRWAKVETPEMVEVPQSLHASVRTNFGNYLNQPMPRQFRLGKSSRPDYPRITRYDIDSAA